MQQVILDTDVASLIIKQPLPAALLGELVGAQTGITSVTLGTRRGRPRPQNDTWIAACCLVYELPLATLNTKDSRDFAEHEGLVLLGT